MAPKLSGRPSALMSSFVEFDVEIFGQLGTNGRQLEHLGSRIRRRREHAAVHGGDLVLIIDRAWRETIGIKFALPHDECDRDLQIFQRLSRETHDPRAVGVNADLAAFANAVQHRGRHVVAVNLPSAASQDVPTLAHVLKCIRAGALRAEADIDAARLGHVLQTLVCLIQPRVSAPAYVGAGQRLRQLRNTTFVDREVVVWKTHKIDAIAVNQPANLFRYILR
jgi:hypothetical protein